VLASGCAKDRVETTSATSAAGSSGPAGTTSTTTAAARNDAPLAGFDEVAAMVDEFVTKNGLNGAGLVVVDANDGVIAEHYTGVFGPDRVSLVASSSKMITAGVLMRLADQGSLDMDRPLADAAPWGAGNPTITAAQLVSNSSGLVGLSADDVYWPYACQYIAAGSLQECGTAIFTTAADDADVIAPDTEFRYGGGQWQVAGALAEAVSGKSWAQLINETYSTPCGLTSLGYNNHYAQIVSPQGAFAYPPQFDGSPAALKSTDNPNMEGGAYISPKDYASLLLMHLRGGRCGDEQVLSTAAVDRMHADRLKPAFNGTASGGQGYGLGWWVSPEDPQRIQDGGSFGSVPWLDLGRGYGAYVVIEDTARAGEQLARKVRPLIETAIDQRNNG